MSLSTKNRAYLRSLANTMKPSLTLGKGEADENFLKALENALTAHELVKVRILPTAEKEPNELLSELSAATMSEPVNRLGRVLTLYRPNPKKKDPIVLPKK